jgi:diadenosine tetraphosphatase ApaH/serine/threonine PP2A family protein phosphatase
MRESLFAVFGDVHSNLEALEAVLKDMDSLGISHRVCLGDTVGYAANPGKCLQRVRSLGCPILQGNHDEAAAGDAESNGMRDIARAGIDYARAKLSKEQRRYLGSLPMTWQGESCECVHASLEVPKEWNYVVQELDARAHFAEQKKPLSFCGHTHVPLVWHLTAAETLGVAHGLGKFSLPKTGKTLVNVGSVGQPRDYHPEACYVIWNEQGGWVEFRRVPYDIARTRRKILRAQLPRFIATRLLTGQ